uniref:Transmembrane protein 44 n=1 Tax=Calidris pygmaea TaxID=425635 RepID=A0A8C3KDP6_9CHAR
TSTLPCPAPAGECWPGCDTCLAGEPGCVSWGLWMLAALCWIAARSLLSCRCPGQGRRQASLLFLLYTFLGHVCSTVGALLASQLGIQVGKAPGGAGDGWVAPRMGEEWGTWCGPIPPLWAKPVPESEPMSHAGPPRQRGRRRRRWLQDGLLALALPLSMGAGRSLLTTSPRLSLERPEGARRRLLGAVLEVRCPLLIPPGAGGQSPVKHRRCWALSTRGFCSDCRGKPCPRRRLWATFCSATAGVLYAAAIVTHDQQPAHLLRALPWLLIALGSAALDVAVSFPRALGASGLYRRSLMPGLPWLERKMMEEQRKKRLFFLPLCLKGRKEMMSPFVLLLFPVPSQTGHGVARLPGDAQMGAAGSVPPQPPVCSPLLALHPGLSPSGSSDATSINSELEVSACSWLFRCCFFSLGPCSVVCPGTFRQPAAPLRRPKHPSPHPSKQ